MKVKYYKIKQYDFEEIKQVVDRDNLLDYTDFNEEFKTHTDDRNFQLGVVIRQNANPIYSHSIELTGSQTKYTIT